MTETQTPRKRPSGVRPRGTAAARSAPAGDFIPLQTPPPGPGLVFDPLALQSARRLVRNASLWAILVGIDDYDDPAIPPLQYCGHDAQALAAFFADFKQIGYRSSTIRLLAPGLERRRLPTRSNIMKAVRELAQTADREDVILFGFFGHGITAGGKSYLLACDSVDAQQTDTGVELRWVLQTLQDSKAQVKLMIFDACHSGELIGRAPALHLSEDFIRTFQESVQSRGWAVLSACNRDQRSYEDSESEHGIFTHCLLEGLRGAADKDSDGVITVHDVYSYARQRTREWAFARSYQQNPELAWNLTEGDDIVLVSRPVVEQPVPVPVPVIAVMGVKGGVGKGTFVNCAAQLIADNGPDTDVAVLDFDLENEGASLVAEHRFALNPRVKTVFDHIAPFSTGFGEHVTNPSEKLWDITPSYLAQRGRGRIWLLPARETGSTLNGFEIVANVPAESRNETLLHLTQEMIERVRRQLPKIRCILIDCGASNQNPLYLAAFAAAHYRFIVAMPNPAFRKNIGQIRSLFQQSHGDREPEELKTFVVVNRVTKMSERKQAREELGAIGCIERDPLFEEADHELGGVDYDLGFPTVFLDMQQCLAAALDKEHEDLLPDERHVRITPWWARLVEDGLAASKLASRRFRLHTYAAWGAAAASTVALAVSGVWAWRLWQKTEAFNEGALSAVPFLLALGLLGISLFYLVRQMGKRSLLQKIARLKPGEGEGLLDELMQQKDNWKLRWLHELVSLEQTVEKLRRRMS